MDNIRLGQYVEKNSIIHRLDPRSKIICLILLMTAVFLIPSPVNSEHPIFSFIAMGAVAFVVFVIILLTKVSIGKYLYSIRQIIFIVFFAFCVQVFSPNTSGDVFPIDLKFNFINIGISILLLVLFFFIRKHLPMKIIILILLLCLCGYLLTLDFGVSSKTVELKVYEYGIYNGCFYSIRILLVIMLSTVLTLTTKPTEITLGLERLLKPLTYLKINVSVFAMMISLALRYIPTLFDETNKILKAQSSRGADFSEGKLKDQIKQIISLLIPMFVISYKRAEDLAYAMEARGYIPGAKRTSINVLHFKVTDYLSLILSILGMAAIIVGRILL